MQRLTYNPELEILLKRYVWWESTKWAADHPTIFLANLMNMGLWDDIQLARKLLGDDILLEALKAAPPGYFNYRAWDYWHLKFGMMPIPPLPKRNFK